MEAETRGASGVAFRSAVAGVEGFFADIDHASSREELRWAQVFVHKLWDTNWCYGLALFDARAIEGPVMSTAEIGCGDDRTPRNLRRDETKWSHDLQALISGVQREAVVVPADGVPRGSYSRVPSYLEYYEVLWGFLAESPRAASLWGLELAVAPYKAIESARERENGMLAHAFWAATLSQWAMNSAGYLLAEAACAWHGAESGDSGRL